MLINLLTLLQINIKTMIVEFKHVREDSKEIYEKEIKSSLTSSGEAAFINTKDYV